MIRPPGFPREHVLWFCSERDRSNNIESQCLKQFDRLLGAIKELARGGVCRREQL